jgi:EAL domain-containing protein (putative c-di-GMP-specific phosphodiesterase class I)
VDFLKIDGSFIVDILRDPADYALVDAINRIGHVLGIQTIAESVENKAILDILGRLEVDYVQGNIIHKPEPFIGLIDASEPARSLGTGIPRALH